MDYRITGLQPAQFSPLHGLDDAALAKHRALRKICDSNPGFPCRVTLEDAQPGEKVLLLNFEHLSVDSPYRSSHAIYVRESATAPFDAVGVIPPALRSRLLSVRAFDALGHIVDAEIAEGQVVEPLIERFFALDEVSYIHAHFARRGCFAARIDRV
jgi:hypothetical protein